MTTERAGNPDCPQAHQDTSRSHLVWWDEPADHDPSNPLSWPRRTKWTIIATMSFMTFLTPLASAMLAPAVPAIMRDFGNTSEYFATFVVSIFVLGFAVGPLIIAPLSEIYGRTPVYNICNGFFVVVTIMCAVAKDSGMILACRFWAGVFGVATVTCGGGTIADMLPTEQRGRAMALWSMGPLLGPVIGPICGGVIVEHAGWRWVFWVIVILGGIATSMGLLIFKETYAPVLLERKAALLQKETGENYKSRLASEEAPRKVLKQSITRPIKMLFTFPVVTLMCTYIAFLYGAMYILFTTFTFVFEQQYGFSATAAGLSFLGSGIGSFIGLAYGGILSDRSVKKQKLLGKQPAPEDRLPYVLTVPAALSLPIGLFLYGWAIEYHLHWIVPEIGTAITGFGSITILMCIQTYLVDAYTRYAASVTAANSCLRSIFGGLLPLGGLQLYKSLGFGWGNSLLAFIALAMAPMPIVFRQWGSKLRASSLEKHRSIESGVGR